MINRHVRALMCMLCATAWAGAAPPPATTQSLEQRMIDLAPVLSIADPATKSFDVQIVINTGGPQLMMRALYDGPERRAIYISDPRDGTPLCVIIGNRQIMYDPVAGVLRTSDGASASLTLKQDGNTLNLNFGFHGAKDGEAPQPWSIDVDVASLVKRGSASEVIELGGGMYGLRQRGKKGMLYSAIDPTRSSPYTRVELLDDGKPAIVIDPLTRNEPVDPRAFDLADDKQIAQKMPVEDWPHGNLLATARGTQALMQTVLSRLAADDPKWRAQLDQKWVTRVNWAKVKENDAKFAPILRELFPLATAAPSGGGQPATKPAADSNGPAANRAQ